MYKSKEIRWFSKTEDPGISKWFETHAYIFENTTPRTDYYLLLKDQKNTGIKLREGNIEIKQLISRSDKEKLVKKVKGYFEHYIKWSFNSAEDDLLMQQVIEEEKFNWIAVRKERIGYKLKENENGSIIKVKLDEFPDFGCQVEYTRLKIKEEIWYTLALEWFGDEELQFDLSILNQMLSENKLKAKKSMGYAEFLQRFRTNLT